MSLIVPHQRIDFECAFCRQHFSRSLSYLTRYQAVVCPHCAQMEAFDENEITEISERINASDDFARDAVNE